jgi:S1-C subfamily serine protease
VRRNPRLTRLSRRLTAAAALVLIVAAPARAPSQDAAPAVREALGSVASIRATGLRGTDETLREASGFFCGARLVLTRRSAVENADTLVVTAADGRRARARLLECDRCTEIAVLEHGIEDPVPVLMGSSAGLKPGEPLTVLGNSLGIFPSVTLARFRGRRPDGTLEIDAALPAGNTGSPVLDSAGRLVGMIAGRQTAGPGRDGRETGLALPVEAVRKVLEPFLAAKSGSGWIGMSVVETEADREGGSVRVVAVVPGGPAARASIAIGDTIVLFRERRVRRAQDLAEWVRTLEPDSRVTFTVRKGEKRIPRTVRVARPPKLAP